MNKAQIIEALRAAGVECDDSMTVEQLKQLAADNNVALTKAAAAGPTDDELVAQKVAAGLSLEDAIDVVRRQRESDKANKA